MATYLRVSIIILWLVNAANSFSSFGTTGTSDDNKEKLLLSSPTLLTRQAEIAKSEYCDSNNTQYPCASEQQYYGCGPLQLTGDENYGAAGTYVGTDLLNNPGLVSQDDLTSWKNTLWFWNVNNNFHTGQGFGATIKAINGAIECNGGNTNQVNDRISYYNNYCSQFGVDPGSNLSC